MSRLTDTQLIILSSASQRNDRGVDLPANVTGEALRKAVDKLIRAGLLEEVRANGSLLGWRSDVGAGPMALRITKQGLEAIGVRDDAVGAPTETSICAAPAPKVETSAAEAIGSRKRISLAARPLGYAIKDRKIVVVEEEAERVRTIFRSYLKLGSLNRLMTHLRQQGSSPRCVVTAAPLHDGHAVTAAIA
jgi:hypothetical protein